MQRVWEGEWAWGPAVACGAFWAWRATSYSQGPSWWLYPIPFPPSTPLEAKAGPCIPSTFCSALWPGRWQPPRRP